MKETSHNHMDTREQNWSCYLFGNKPGGAGFVYIPEAGAVPNFFIRWMMKVCLACMWVKKDPNSDKPPIWNIVTKSPENPT